MGDCNMILENKKVFYENNEVDPIEIYKYLPKLDCKKCRYQSCLSFAIMLATYLSKYKITLKCFTILERIKIKLALIV